MTEVLGSLTLELDGVRYGTVIRSDYTEHDFTHMIVQTIEKHKGATIC